ncbi:MAG: divalent metal cation transporter [Bacteroidales bacterium]|nr:MAG: divalent metal cation transporter [Bacteroidales bacterium]
MLRRRIINILFWSVISAAFIGPGTITTAAKAGAGYRFDLLWALVFSTIACLLLQEASARITIFSGRNLGEAISSRFRNRSSRIGILILIVGAIIAGSAAYETGNILGAMAGVQLILPVPRFFLVLIIGLLAAVALSIPSLRIIAKLMGYIVVVMGFSFLATAIALKPQLVMILKGGFIPSLPEPAGAGWLVLGLIGTTVVPYNLFLGSGITDKNQDIKEMRIGLSVAVLLGGIISMAVLVVGTAVTGEFNYDNLVNTLSGKLGKWAILIFGLGMFSAGFTSAITAPLASAITAKSLFFSPQRETWRITGRNFKMVWGFVLMTGIVLGLTNIEPIPAIILAQALNGLVLPVISIFLLFVVNDSGLMGREGVNGWFTNILLGLVVWVTLVIGLTNIMRAIQNIPGMMAMDQSKTILPVSVVSLMFSILVFLKIYRIRMNRNPNE